MRSGIWKVYQVCLHRRFVTITVLIVSSILLLLVINSVGINMWQPSESMDLKYSSYRTIAYGHNFFGRKHYLGFGDEKFAKCLYKKCMYIDNRDASDAVIFHGPDIQSTWWLPWKQNHRQIWIYVNQESPYLDNIDPSQLNHIFNWTCTYDRNSDVFMPYGTLVPRTKALNINDIKNGIKSKSKLAVIASSHCGALPSQRWEIIKELENHIPVDIFGKCGSGLKCGTTADDSCFSMFGKTYKFYLAFENALCQDYITEKLYFNSFAYSMVPVVLGGLSKLDYEKILPKGSFIYAEDFANVSSLADYLISLDHDDERYISFLRWQLEYEATTEFNPSCALCAALHNETLISKQQIVNELATMRGVSHVCRSPTIYNSSAIDSGGFKPFIEAKKLLLFFSIMFIKAIHAIL